MSDEAKKIALIATLPKSGTWYAHTFFWCYDQLLRHSERYLRGKFKPDLQKALAKHQLSDETTHQDTLAIDKLYICHTICPGFSELKDSHHQRWEALHFPVPGYHAGESVIRERGDWDRLNPATHSNARIVYLYRNPLDHFVSFHRHAQNHVDDRHRFKTLSDGSRVPINDMHDLVFKFGGLSAFIKHFYTYQQMQHAYPKNVMRVSYEDLTTDPKNTFHQILSFIGAAPDNAVQWELFEAALSMCSKDALMKIESKTQKAMAGDQKGNERHIRGGEIGKWRNHFVRQELEAIEAALTVFDISLNDFTLVGGESALVSLPWLAEMSAQKYRVEFFLHQLGEAGKMLNTKKSVQPLEPLKLNKVSIWLNAIKRFLGRKPMILNRSESN